MSDESDESGEEGLAKSTQGRRSRFRSLFRPEDKAVQVTATTDEVAPSENELIDVGDQTTSWQAPEFLIDLDNDGRYSDAEVSATSSPSEPQQNPPDEPPSVIVEAADVPVAPSSIEPLPDSTTATSDLASVRVDGGPSFQDEHSNDREDIPFAPDAPEEPSEGPAALVGAAWAAAGARYPNPTSSAASVALPTAGVDETSASAEAGSAPPTDTTDDPIPADEPPATSALSTTPRSSLLGKLGSFAPEILVALAVIFGFIVEQAQRLPVAYPNDSAVHSLTVDWATKQLLAGHFPLDGWFPFLSLGSPFFLHYQSASAVLTGALGMVVGSSTAFGWTLWILLSTWPISIYLGARLFGFSRWTAACAAAASLLIFSNTGYGLEIQSYDWYGSGLWSQLWGTWMLPIAAGYTWQAVARKRHTFAAVLSFGALICFHFLTAYLVGLLVILWALIRPSEFFGRIKRTVIVGFGAALVACWILVPLVMTDKWAATNEFEIGEFWDNGYGAKFILSSLIHGRLFDSTFSGAAGRFPIFTLLAAVGCIVALITFRRDERSRVVITIAVISLLLTFGRTTFGSAVNVLPYNSQLLLHRYVMGIDFAGILFVGIGLESLYQVAASLVRIFLSRRALRAIARPALFGIGSLALVGLVVVALAPAWTAIESYGHFNAVEIGYQRQIDNKQGAQVNELINTAQSLGGGRIYAGMPSNWGRDFLVGSVPVYIYLTDEGVDAVGFTLRTSSLMTDPEAYFDETNPGDYEAFGIHYLLLPVGKAAPISSAKLIETAGNYTLWVVPSTGYIHVIDTVAPLTANGTDLGHQTASFLSSSLIDENRYPTVAFDGQPAAAPTLSSDAPLSSELAGTVISEHDDLDEGQASATVAVNRTAVVLLSASFDGGWTVTVDGQQATPIMVAPALVGVTVPAGNHTVSFVYKAYPYYPELFVLAAITLLGFWFLPRRRHRRALSSGAQSTSTELDSEASEPHPDHRETAPSVDDGTDPQA